MANAEKKPPLGVILDILVSDIKVRWDWNARGTKFKTGTVAENESSFEDLVHSIQVNGQQQPVKVIFNRSGGKETFELVEGFRRLAAAHQLKMDSVKAIVFELSPLEARRANLSENTARSDLKAADLAFGLADYKAEHLKAKKTWVGLQIAHELGINQGYVNMLDHIMTEISPAITKDWREGPISVPVQKINELVKVPLDKQPDAWEKMKQQQATKADGRTAKGREEKLVESAVRVGKMLGELTLHGYITVGNFDSFEPDFWKLLNVSVPEELAEDMLPKMTEAAQKAYSLAINPPTKEEPAKAPKAKK
jgi:ParB/RepB/Spo0J family partition protein